MLSADELDAVAFVALTHTIDTLGMKGFAVELRMVMSMRVLNNELSLPKMAIAAAWIRWDTRTR